MRTDGMNSLCSHNRSTQQCYWASQQSLRVSVSESNWMWLQQSAQCVHTLPSHAFKPSPATGINVHVCFGVATCGSWPVASDDFTPAATRSCLQVYFFFFFAEPICFPHIISSYVCLHSPSLFKWVVKHLWGKCDEVVEKLSLREVTDPSRRRQAAGAHVYPALISLF